MSASSKFLVLTSRSMRSILSIASCAELAFNCMLLYLVSISRCSLRNCEYSLANASYLLRQSVTWSCS